METKKTVQISFVILLIMMVIALVYSGTAAFAPAVLVSRSFFSFTGQSWSEFANSDSVLSNYMLTLERMAAGLGLATSIGGLFVLLKVFRKGVKWAWYYILVVGVLGWANNLLANIIFKNSLIIIIIIVGLVLIGIGLLISARTFLKKE